MSSEYSYWIEVFEEKSFKNNLLKLQKHLKNKKVVFYCNGIFFDALTDAYNLNDFFEVVGISDLRYETNQQKSYKNFQCIKPSDLRKQKIDYVLVCSPNPDFVKKYLKKNELLNEHTKILPVYKQSNDIFYRFLLALKFQKITKDAFKALKYFFFCSNDELKAKINYERVLRKIKKKDKIKVLFVCEENQKWGYQFVYELMSKNPKYEILPILVYPIITKERVDFTQKENIEFFKKLGIEAMDGYDYEKKVNVDIKSYSPDIVFYQQPWYLQGNNHPVEVSKSALTIMIPYGYTTLNEKFWGSDAVKKVYSSLWCFFSESSYHNEFYKKAAGMRYKDNLYATGTPKLDYYKKTINPCYEKLWKGSGKRIIWAPHHSINNRGLAMSNFQEYCYFMLDFAKSHTEYSFLLKPHPALKSSCISAGFMSESEFDSYLKEWSLLSNASVYTQGNYFDIFKTSDLLVTDCSSFIAEYFPSKKPIILLDRKTRAPFDKFGKKLENGLYKVENPKELCSMVKKILDLNNDYLVTTRNNILDSCFYLPEEGSSKIIVEYLDGIFVNKE